MDALKRRKDKPPVDLSNPDCIAWGDMPKCWQKAMRRHHKAGGEVEFSVPTGNFWVPDSDFDPFTFDCVAYRAAPIQTP